MALDKSDIKDIKKVIKAYVVKLFYTLYTKNSILPD